MVCAVFRQEAAFCLTASFLSHPVGLYCHHAAQVNHRAPAPGFDRIKAQVMGYGRADAGVAPLPLDGLLHAVVPQAQVGRQLREADAAKFDELFQVIVAGHVKSFGGGGVVSAHELAEAYTVFVTEIFMTPDGCARPEVDEELIRLGESGELQNARKDSRIDSLIDEILGCAPESRSEVFRKTDSRLLALVYERVLLGSQILLKAAQQGIKLPTHGAPLLAELFRKLLLQQLKP